MFTLRIVPWIFYLQSVFRMYLYWVYWAGFSFHIFVCNKKFFYFKSIGYSIPVVFDRAAGGKFFLGRGPHIVD